MFIMRVIINLRKGVSPLIATILLVVVAVVLVTIILGWGKSFTTSSLDNANSILSYKASDAQYYLTIKDGTNGRYFVSYDPPTSFDNGSITITDFSWLDYNNIIPLTSNVTINRGEIATLDLGLINTQSNIMLYLDNNTYITKMNVKNTNRSPSSSDCPTGYIPVPGNAMYGTSQGSYSSKGGFCVAKYEMKVDQNNDGVGDSNTSCQYSTYQVWDNAASGCSVDNVNRKLVSSKDGYPLTNISQTNSVTACSQLGSNYHLITNNEWMTIVRNAELVTSNWSGGAIGSGYIYSGHNDNNPAYALTADSNDSNGYYLTGNSSGNQRRTLTLTNGQVLWDLAGNVYEWNNNTLYRKYMPDGIYDTNSSSYVGWGWMDYSTSGGSSSALHIINDGNDSVLGYNALKLLTSNIYTASSNGIGRIYTYSDPSDTSTSVYTLRRGGGWGDGSYAGVLYLYLSSSTSGKDGRRLSGFVA